MRKMKTYIDHLVEQIEDLEGLPQHSWSRRYKVNVKQALSEFKGQYAMLTGTPYDPNDSKDYEEVLEYCC